jgi:hypothetical protein
MIFDKYMQRTGVKFLHRTIVIPKRDYTRVKPEIGMIDIGTTPNKF